jgi:hypothetical protein
MVDSTLESSEMRIQSGLMMNGDLDISPGEETLGQGKALNTDQGLKTGKKIDPDQEVMVRDQEEEALMTGDDLDMTVETVLMIMRNSNIVLTEDHHQDPLLMTLIQRIFGQTTLSLRISDPMIPISIMTGLTSMVMMTILNPSMVVMKISNQSLMSHCRTMRWLTLSSHLNLKTQQSCLWDLRTQLWYQ